MLRGLQSGIGLGFADFQQLCGTRGGLRSQRGELSATDLARAHFADDLAAALAPATFTLADLATHHAGLPDMPANLVDRDGDGTRDPGADPLSPAAGYARLDLAHALAADPPGAAAGYRYSNLGVGLLGLALADQLGTASHHAVLRALVADALGMSDTWGQVAALDAAAIARVAPGLAVNGGRRVAGRLAQMGVLAGAGEVVTSGDDLVHLLAALTGNVTSALDDAIELALASHATGPSAAIDLGYAFEIERLPDGARYTKGGATASYTAYLAFRRTPAEGAVILSPCGGFSAVRDLALALDEQLAARSR